MSIDIIMKMEVKILEKDLFLMQNIVKSSSIKPYGPKSVLHLDFPS